MNELLICALKRRGQPGTAGDLYDDAIGLAQDAGWPRRSWTQTSVQQAAALLKGMAQRGEIERVGSRKENGRDVPMFAPRPHSDPLASRWDPCAPLPEAPDREGEDHPLHGLTSRQKFVIFDLMESTLQTYARCRHELVQLMDRHNTELRDVFARAKRELLSAGIIDEEKSG